MPTATVRSTALRDRPGVLRLVGAAFSDHARDGREEVEIVERTWALISPHEAIDLVAIDEGAIVGHVLAAPGRVDEMPLLGVAPLAVAPAHQSRGIGTALMTELLQRAEKAGWGAVVLLGEPAYYDRFGFNSAAALGIFYPPVGPESPYFQARRFGRDDLLPQGSFRYIWEDPETSP